MKRYVIKTRPKDPQEVEKNTEFKRVYIMEGVDSLHTLTHGKVGALIKVGITNNLERRRKEINKGLTAKIVTIDGKKQSSEIKNPEIIAFSEPLAYAEALEKRTQNLCDKWMYEEFGTSGKIQGYNDWIIAPSYSHAVLALVYSIAALEEEIHIDEQDLVVNLPSTFGRFTYPLMAKDMYETRMLIQTISDESQEVVDDTTYFHKTNKKEQYRIRDISTNESAEMIAVDGSWGAPDNEIMMLVIRVKKLLPSARLSKKQLKKLNRSSDDRRFRVPIRKKTLLAYISREQLDISKLGWQDLMILLVLSNSGGMTGILPQSRSVCFAPHLYRMNEFGEEEAYENFEEYWQLSLTRAGKTINGKTPTDRLMGYLCDLVPDAQMFGLYPNTEVFSMGKG